MKRFLGLILILGAIGWYLHAIHGWDWARVRRLPYVSLVWKEDASATTTPIGKRGTGTHWETATPMPAGRTEFGAAILNGTIYVIGGHDGYLRSLDSALAYDIGADAWRTLPPMPQEVHHPAVTTDGKRIYVVGGLSGFASRPLDSVFVFDPLKNAWEELGRLNDFRGAAGAAVLDDRLHVLGGLTTAGEDAIFEWYDATRSGWNGLKNMPTARYDLAAVTLDGKIYALGGRTGGKDSAATEMYSTITEWKTLQAMPTPRSSFSAVAAEGKIFVFGGSDKDGALAQIETFDPKKGVWSSFPLTLPHPRRGLAALSYKDRIYVIGGGGRKGFSVSDMNEVLFLAPEAKK